MPFAFALQKNIRRASITIDAILKLNPSLSSTGPVVDVDEDEKAKDGDVVKRKTKAKKERRKSLTDMCKVGFSSWTRTNS